MHTQLFKTFKQANKTAIAEYISVGSGEQQAWAHRITLKDYGDTTIAERSFAWTPGEKRTLRVFTLRNGDIGYRAFGSGLADSDHATRLFREPSEAIDFMNDVANVYINSGKGWKEI